MPLSRTKDSVLGDLVKILLAIVLPPLGVFLEVGLGKHFWINIILTLFGFIPGIVHAVYIIATRQKVETHGRGSTDAVNRETLLKLQRLSDTMDRAFLIPGTNIRFGLDSVVGLIPVIGDTLSFAVSGYIFSFAKKAGVPLHKRMGMVWNIFIDWLIGLIPLLGDVFDVAFKANSKNIRIITAHVESQIDGAISDSDNERVT